MFLAESLSNKAHNDIVKISAEKINRTFGDGIYGRS